MRRTSLGWLVALAVSACDGTMIGADGGVPAPDASADSGVTEGADGGMDAAAPETDAGPPADAGTAVTDAGSDAGPPGVPRRGRSRARGAGSSMRAAIPTL